MGLAPETTLPDGRVDAKSLNLSGIRQLVEGIGKEDWRALQIYKWIWKRGASSFHDVDSISRQARAELDHRAWLPMLDLATRLDSEDGTRKYVWRLSDGAYIESVLIPDEEHPGGRRLTLCVSSQVGCAMACRFCLTGDLGLKRHLSASEIANQLLQVQADLGANRRITNVVLMGMGEPLHNLDPVIIATQNMMHNDAMGMSHRKITVSTVGLVPAMKELTARSPVNIAVSLNATTQEQRRQIMPITARWSLAELMDCCKALPLPRAKRITFEYVMFKGFNDQMDDAQRLVELMQGMRCKLNLIPYNENPQRDLRRPSDLTVWRFQDLLVSRGIHTSVRRTRGRDISAACGQLGGAGHLADRVSAADPSAAWRAAQIQAARRGETRHIEDGKGDLLGSPSRSSRATDPPTTVTESAFPNA
ncbi:MAG: 23S rRNA (adenine(2503)-C(2))-methyltransferase RlmN [Oligoflexia bacterium]|nr:23S rRNA (adenine(2503)-C(2))-methyltransferase RlmN [Oligoflexia bacterium]